jgi:predicted nucleic acid-binding protein
MILVDTSVWIDHINASDPVLSSLLVEERVLAHTYVIGEISLASLRDRDVCLERCSICRARQLQRRRKRFI